MSDLIDNAVELLERDGWCRHNLEQSARGRRCVLGALARAIAGPEGDLMLAAAEDSSFKRTYIALQEVTGFDSVAYWNNYIAQSAGEVIDTLKLAGKILEEVSA